MAALPLSLWFALAGLLLFGLLRWALRADNRPRILPFGLLMAWCAASAAADAAGAIKPAAEFAPWLRLAALILLCWSVARVALAVVVELPRRLRGLEPLPRITRDFVLLLCYAVLTFFILRVHGGVNLAGLITTSAVLTAIIGLAAQATLSSFFSGVVLHLERPFEVGDWIRHGDHVGKVTSITWKATRLLTRDLTQIYVPNEQLTSGQFENYSKPDRRYIAHLFVGLPYETPPHRAREILLEAIGREPPVLADPPPEVRVHDFAESAIAYELWFALADPGVEPRAKSAIRARAWYLLNRAGIKIPFPIRDVQLAHEERRHQRELAEAERAGLAALLARVPVLAPLSDTARGLLAAAVETRLYGAGEIIVRQDEPGDSMFLIRAGACEVLAGRAGEAPARVATLGEHDFFGEMGLLTGEARRATVRALRDTTVIVVGKDAFGAVLQAEPAVSGALAEALARRQQELAAALGRPAAEAPAAPTLVARIRRFFGLA